ncbi:hypothetical protein [Vibrio crassostreae]|uniref:competence protein CoiA family protein n=1 Tax=Vibrio crassostreae TaxID=246167 RepID=UPI001B3147D2|nr:hypothetical protein [Vibrio crassostreae]
MNLIPLGLHNDELIDVSEVHENNKNDITCPSCGNQLVAKKGDVMVHHFAHKSGTGTADACEYSFFVSVARAFRSYTLQLDKLTFVSPELIYTKAEFSKRIEKQRVLTLTNFDIDDSAGHGFTFVYMDGEKKVGVSLAWEDNVSKADVSLVDKAILVDITPLKKKYDEMKRSSKAFSFKRMITDWITLDAPRSFTYHCDFAEIQREIDIQVREHEMDIDKVRKQTSGDNEYRNLSSVCIICKGFKGLKPLIDDNVCFQCVNDKFYMKGIFRVGEITKIVREKYAQEYLQK